MSRRGVAKKTFFLVLKVLEYARFIHWHEAARGNYCAQKGDIYTLRQVFLARNYRILFA